MNFDALRDRIKLHEALRLKPYKDSVGVLTIGYGHNLEEGISHRAAEFLFEEDFEVAVAGVKALVSNFDMLDQRRAEVLIEMCYNLGAPRLAGFKKMLAAVEAKNWKKAADEMKDSLWAKQVKGRAQELAEIMWQG